MNRKRRSSAGPLLAVALSMLLLPVPAAGLTISIPPAPFPELGETQLFARIDSLETQYAVLEGEARAECAVRIGDSYAALGRSKDLIVAQSYYDEALRVRPDFRAARRRSAIEYSRSGYDILARNRMEPLVEQDPGSIEDLLLLARIEYIAARRAAHRKGFDAAYQLYVTAIGLAPDHPEALAGAAATSLLVQNVELALSCAHRWRRVEPASDAAWILGATAEFRRGHFERAWPDFLRGLFHADEPTRQVFLGESMLLAEGVLASIARDTIDPARARRILDLDPDAAYVDWRALANDPRIRPELVETWWMRHDDSPESFVNETQLEYWSRLVESDLRFGRPEAGLRGWDTLPGEVWVRLGRPGFEYNFIARQNVDLEFQQAPGLSTAELGEFKQIGPLLFPVSRRYWNWAYRIDGVSWRIQFMDTSWGEGQWGVSPNSPTDIGILRNELAFVEPRRQRGPDAFEVAVDVARFARGEESILETAVSVRPEALVDSLFAYDSVMVAWTLFDDQDNLIDEVSRMLGPDRCMSRLLALSGQSPSTWGGDPRITLIGARVPTGRYRIKVRATEPRSGLFTERTLEVAVPGETTPAELAISSIQLSHGLPEWDPESAFPPEFVKHGRAVVYAPRAIIEGDLLGVFYEVENLSRDASGQTRFDVEYAVYRGTGEVRLLAMLGQLDLEEVEEIEPTTVQYLQERTGVSPEGAVVKGTEIDVTGLPEGDYVLRVQIHDLLDGRTCSGTVAFRRPPRLASR